eukprot:1158164-Pelagomonas_calceolata.AAC.5
MRGSWRLKAHLRGFLSWECLLISGPCATPRPLPEQGTSGECGLRGGYVEMTNIHPGTIEEVYKCASINLCPNTMGQVRAAQWPIIIWLLQARVLSIAAVCYISVFVHKETPWFSDCVCRCHLSVLYQHTRPEKSAQPDSILPGALSVLPACACVYHKFMFL